MCTNGPIYTMDLWEILKRYGDTYLINSVGLQGEIIPTVTWYYPKIIDSQGNYICYYLGKNHPEWVFYEKLIAGDPVPQDAIPITEDYLFNQDMKYS